LLIVVLVHSGHILFLEVCDPVQSLIRLELCFLLAGREGASVVRWRKTEFKGERHVPKHQNVVQLRPARYRR
jgi:hypothetical protein